jgi:hypothetical protein
MEASAELINNRIQGREDSVADVALAQVIPEMFDGIKFRAGGWERQQVEGWGNI